MKWLKILLSKRKMKKLNLTIFDDFAIVYPNRFKITLVKHPELKTYPKGYYECYLNKELNRYVWLKRLL